MTFQGMTMRLIRPVCGLVLVLLIATPAMAQWKWKDSAGQVHVSDVPPPREVPDKDILKRPTAATRAAAAAPVPATASAASGAAAKPKVDPELEARKAKADAEQKAKIKAEEDKLAAQRAENCQRARQQLATLQSGMRIARLNAKGEREILDDAGRAQEQQTAQRVADADCR
jgi:hypothetical protein